MEILPKVFLKMVQKVVSRKAVLLDKDPQTNFRFLSSREGIVSIHRLNKC